MLDEVLVRQAADPRTDTATLARLASEHPELRPAIASNAATYPELLNWLASLGDPAVDAVLAARPAGSSSALPATEAVANPFAGLPVRDYVRDLLAVLALLISLALPWTGSGQSYSRIDVVLVTVLSVVSVGLPYAGRLGAFPDSWTVVTVRLLRLLANAPYVVVTLVYLVLAVVTSFGGADQWSLGTGLGLGLAGALLAAQPRAHELGPPAADHGIRLLWRRVLLINAVLLGLVGLTVIIEALTQLGSGGAGTAIWIITTVVTTALLVAFALLPQLATYGGAADWQIVTVVLGSVFAVLFVLSTGTGWFPPVFTLSSPSAPLVLLAAGAAIASGSAISQTPGRQRDAVTWIGVASAVFLLVTLLATLRAVVGLLNTLDGADLSYGLLPLILGVVLLATALVGFSSLRERARASRNAGLIVAVVLAVVALAQLVVNVTAEFAFVGFIDILLTFVLPGLAIYALTGPAAIRARFPQPVLPGLSTRSAAAGEPDWRPPPARGDEPQ